MNEPMTLPQDRMWPQSTWLNNRLPQPNHYRHIVPLIRLRWQSLMTCDCWRVIACYGMVFTTVHVT